MSASSQLRNIVSTLQPKAPHGLLIVVGSLFVISLLCVLAMGVYSSLQLQSLVGELSAVASQSNQQPKSLMWIHYAGTALTLILLVVVVYIFLGKLLRTTEQVKTAQDQAEQIVTAAVTGFFRIDRKQVIEDRYSPSLNRILQRDDLVGSNFLGVLGSIVPDNVLATASDFVNLMFGDKVSENLVDELNPLRDIEVHIKDSSGEFEQAYLSFTFNRLYDDKKVSHLLVQVEEVSEKIRLRNQLQVFKEQSDEQFDLLAKVLHVETPLLSKFLVEADQSLESINTILQKRVTSSDENRQKLKGILRTIQTIKGDAGELNLQLFVNKASEFEDMLDELREIPEPNGSDFIPLTIKLDGFMRQVGQFKTLIEKIGTPVEQASDASMENDGSTDASLNAQAKPELLNEKHFVQYANLIAKEHGKSVAFIMTGEELLPEHYNDTVKQIMNRMIGNAVVHGIEIPQERIEAKKSSCGVILANFEQQSDGSITFVFKDDGCGIDLTHVRDVALDRGIITAEQMQSITAQDTTDLIFHSGFSSVSQIDNSTGHGISMDRLAKIVRDMGGSITVDSAAGSHCEFTLTLPGVEHNAMNKSEVA